MKEYPDNTDMQSGQVKEPLSTYSSPYQGGKEKVLFPATCWMIYCIKVMT